jgi:hypothetical protein
MIYDDLPIRKIMIFHNYAKISRRYIEVPYNGDTRKSSMSIGFSWFFPQKPIDFGVPHDYGNSKNLGFGNHQLPDQHRHGCLRHVGTVVNKNPNGIARGWFI